MLFRCENRGKPDFFFWVLICFVHKFLPKLSECSVAFCNISTSGLIIPNTENRRHICSFALEGTFHACDTTIYIHVYIFGIEIARAPILPYQRMDEYKRKFI